MNELALFFWKLVLFMLIGAGMVVIVAYIAVRVYYAQDEYRNVKRRLNPRLAIKKDKRNILGSQIKDSRNSNSKYHY